MKLKKIGAGIILGVGLLSPNIVMASSINSSAMMQKACYAQRRYPLSFDIVFNTMKDLFVKSNIDLVNLSKEDGFIYGKGILKQNDDFYAISITANLKKYQEMTQVSLRASYTLSKQEYATDTAGVGGINFPIPVLWKKQFVTQDTGNIMDPNFYMGFFNNFNRILFDNLMMSDNLDKDMGIVEKKIVKEVEINKTNDISKDINKTNK
jgi:hypothetical protein